MINEKKEPYSNTMNTDKTELFETMPVPKAVAKLAIPTILASLVMVLYNIADTFFVGELNSAVQSAGVTLIAPVMLAFNAVTNLFGVGTSSKMSRAMGEKDYEAVRKSSVFGFYCALACSVLFSLLCTVLKEPLLGILGVDASTHKAASDYMFWTVTCGAVPSIMQVILCYLIRAEGAALHASIGTMSGCILNIILDPVFILPFGLNMGAAGAGLATFISNCFSTAYCLMYLYIKRRDTAVCLNPLEFSFKRAVAGEIFGVGIPASIQNLLNVLGSGILNNLTAAYDNAAVAAMGISHKTAMVPLYFSMGMAQGVMPLIGYNYASGNIKRMKSSISFTYKLGVSLIIMLSALMFAFSGKITEVFLDDPQVIAYGTRFLRGMSAGLTFLCIDFMGVAVFQACGMGKASLAFALSRKLLLEIPALYILNKLFPLYGMAWAQTYAEFILAAASIVVLVKMLRRCENNAPERL